MNRVEGIKEGIVRHVLTPHPDLPPPGGKEMNRYHAPVSSVGKDHPLKGRGDGGQSSLPEGKRKEDIAAPDAEALGKGSHEESQVSSIKFPF